LPTLPHWQKRHIQRNPAQLWHQPVRRQRRRWGSVSGDRPEI